MSIYAPPESEDFKKNMSCTEDEYIAQLSPEKCLEYYERRIVHYEHSAKQPRFKSSDAIKL